MEETTKSPDKDGEDQYRIDQLDALAKNMIRLFDQVAKAVSTMAKRSNGQGPYNVVSEANEAAKSLSEIARHWVADPGKLVAAQGELFKSYADLWGRSVRRFLGEEVEPVV